MYKWFLLPKFCSWIQFQSLIGAIREVSELFCIITVDISYIDEVNTVFVPFMATFGPWKIPCCEGTEEVIKRPCQYDIIVAVEEEYNDCRRYTNT